MKFLLNMNVPRKLAMALSQANHLCRHAGDIGLDRADDTEIMAAARQSGEIILTHDLDYGHLLAFEGTRSPSVIIFRLRDSQPSNLFRQLMSSLLKLEPFLAKGAIVVIEDENLRIRPLPIDLGDIE